MTDLRARPAVDEQVVRPRRAVRLPFLTAAVGMVLAATVLVVWGFSKAADRTEVLMVTAEVEAGTPIPAAALSTTMVGVDEGAGRFYPAGTDLSAVVAATDLAPGDLLTPSLVMSAPELPEGWREVGAVVRPGRFPATVEVGDELVAVPIDTPGEVSVTVVSSSVGEDGSLSVVLASPGADAGQVARWAAGEQLALVRVR
jgi:hypothetical protein